MSGITFLVRVSCKYVVEPTKSTYPLSRPARVTIFSYYVPVRLWTGTGANEILNQVKVA